MQTIATFSFVAGEELLPLVYHELRTLAAAKPETSPVKPPPEPSNWKPH